LSTFKYFWVGAIIEEILDTKFDVVTLREKLELPGVAGGITPTVFTANKGIWQIETTTDQIADAMRHVREVLASICDSLQSNYNENFSAFPFPRILNNYAVPTQYTKDLFATVEINATDTSYEKPPNAWSKGPLRNHYTKQICKQHTPASTLPQTNKQTKQPQDDKKKSLRQELQALKEKFNKITQLLTKTCSAQKTMVELLTAKLANKDIDSQQGNINEMILQQTIAKQLELFMPSIIAATVIICCKTNY